MRQAEHMAVGLLDGALQCDRGVCREHISVFLKGREPIRAATRRQHFEVPGAAVNPAGAPEAAPLEDIQIDHSHAVACGE